MAQDPYGYPEAVPASPADAASTSMWLGVAALICGAISPCCCYFTWIVALPLSIGAIWKGAQVPQGAEPGRRSAALAGIVSGSVGLVFSTMFILVWLFYVLYAVAIVVAVAAGEM